MIDRDYALEVRDAGLKAISDLSRALNIGANRCSTQDYEKIKRGVGLSIGKIQCDLLDVLYEQYPELDDLR